MANITSKVPKVSSARGDGGLRWAWLARLQEERFLEERQQAASRGEILTAPKLRAGLEKPTGRRVS